MTRVVLCIVVSIGMWLPHAQQPVRGDCCSDGDAKAAVEKACACCCHKGGQTQQPAEQDHGCGCQPGCLNCGGSAPAAVVAACSTVGGLNPAFAVACEATVVRLGPAIAPLIQPPRA